MLSMWREEKETCCNYMTQDFECFYATVFNKEFLFIWELNSSKELVFIKGNSRKIFHYFHSIG